MTQDKTRNPPSVVKIIKYWMDNNIFEDEPSSWFNPAIDVGEPSCFGCGLWTDNWDIKHKDNRRNTWQKCWKGATEGLGLERAHVIPYSLGGSDEPSNFVMLCAECHADAPNVNNREYFLRWVLRRPNTICDIIKENIKLCLQQFPDVKRELDLSKQTKRKEGLSLFHVMAIPKYLKMFKDYQMKNTSWHAAFGKNPGKDRYPTSCYATVSFLQTLIDNQELDKIRKMSQKATQNE